MQSEKLEVSARGNLVILDDRGREALHAEEFLLSKLKEAGCTKSPHIFVQMMLESDLYKILRNNFPDFSPNTGCLCIFPGRSAEKIRERTEWQDCYVGSVFNCDTFLSVHASRRFDTFGNAMVTVGEILPNRTVCPEIRNIIVVDDVISSGITCRKLCERNRHKFPKALWYACACVSRQEKIPGYKEVVTPLLIPLDASGLKVPINSLSTLIDGEDVVGKEYARKHCARPDIFIAALATVRSEYDYDHDPTRDMQMHLIPWRDSLDRAILHLPFF